MRTIREVIERESQIPDNPERIISLSPSVTEILYELGMEDRIAGISAFCVRPESTMKKRRVGSYGSLKDYILKEINPDLVLMMSGYQNSLYEEVRAKYTSYLFQLPVTLHSVLSLVTMVGLVVNRRREASSLLSDLSATVPLPKKGFEKRAYIEIDLGGPTSFGSFSYICNTLNFYGMNTPYDYVDREWLIPDPDEVRKFDPEVIIFEPKMFGDRKRLNVDQIIRERSWEEISAVKNGNIFVTPGRYDFFAHHGPSFIRVVLPWLDSIIGSL
ncbi:MAG: ABC transporter substrate-binding protein [Candidatus Thermoplasmatota archaeon]|nr:ABC transporter substrate-binding protein [Candidatus Thermoplasmatota archaeon]MCL5665734.1 ABC transporter substrate-binding protein [Candidatus Thermoplasmatota archaeon]